MKFEPVFADHHDRPEERTQPLYPRLSSIVREARNARTQPRCGAASSRSSIQPLISTPGRGAEVARRCPHAGQFMETPARRTSHSRPGAQWGSQTPTRPPWRRLHRLRTRRSPARRRSRARTGQPRAHGGYAYRPRRAPRSSSWRAIRSAAPGARGQAAHRAPRTSPARSGARCVPPRRTPPGSLPGANTSAASRLPGSAWSVT